MVAVALALAPTLPAVAQEPLNIPRLEGPVIIDGYVDEEAWEAIEPLPMVMHLPNFGEEPTRQTVLRIAHDDDYLYIAARCYIDPRDIFDTSLRRNVWTTGTDYIAVVLDSYLDRETAFGFGVTPTGARVDYAVSNDASGAAPISTSFDTFWDAAAVRTDYGWSAEMRIPFSSLRFRDADGEVRMGLIAWRWMASNAEMNTFPAIETRWGWWSWTKPSQAQEVVFKGVYSRRPLYVTPYVLGGFGQEHRLDGSGTAFLRHDEPAHEIGLDLKYGITSDLTLDLTLNTDFAQVEADDQQVNLTRFPLFFPERRVFFQERSSLFDFGADEPSSLFRGTARTHELFYSRRIGLHEGQPVRILGGARLAGRIGPWDVGLLNMQTARETGLIGLEEALPSENFGVARLRRQVLNPYSYAGGMVTGRLRSDGTYNVVAGADGVFRVFGEDYLSLSLARSIDDREHGGGLESARLQALWERRALDGPGYQLSASRSGSRYLPGMGFARRHDYARVGDRLFYAWLPGEESPIQRHAVILNAMAFLRNDDGSLETLEIGPSWEGRFKNDAQFEARAFLLRENLRTGFLLADGVEVPAGKYAFPMVSGTYLTSSLFRLRARFRLQAGSFYDGYRVSPSVQPFWMMSRHFDLSGFYGLDVVRFPDRDQSMTAHVARVRLEGMLDTRLSAVTFVQYNSALDAVIANFRLRYNRGDGRDLYVVYNEQLSTNRNGVVPVLPLSAQRAIMAKYTHTLVW